MPYQVIGIRTHRWTELEETLYHKLHDAFSPEQIFVIVDETQGPVEVPNHVQKIGWDKEFIATQGLLDYDYFQRGIGWLCGDYFYYAFQQAVLADYYWLIEPDVSLTFDSWHEEFFNPCHAIEAGALLGHFRAVPENDDWYQAARLMAEEVYTCSFPLNRLSYQAIHRCFLERQRLSALFEDHQSYSYQNNSLGLPFPNDETLVATTLVRDGVVVKDFQDLLPNSFNFFDASHVFEVSKELPLRPARQVIHPVRSRATIVEDLAKTIIGNLQEDLLLSELIVAPEHARAVADDVGHLVSDYLGTILRYQSEFTLDFSELKDLVEQTLPEAPFPTYSWTYLQHIFVVDMPVNDKVLTTEFHLEGKQVTCYTFNRQLSDWALAFQANHPHLAIENGKVKQFSLTMTQPADIKPAIEEAMSNFFNAVAR